MAVIINKGQRTYSLHDGPNGEKRSLEPGASIEVSAEEAKKMLGYNDIVDASKAVPQNAQEIERLTKENARLKAEQEELKKMEAAKAPEPAPDPASKPEPVHAGKAEKPAPKEKWQPMNKKKAKR